MNMRQFQNTRKSPFAKSFSTLITFTIASALTCTFSSCAKKKDTKVAAATAAPAVPAPPPLPPVAPTNPAPASSANAPTPQEDMPYEDLTWIQAILDPAMGTFQATLTGPRDIQLPDSEQDSESDSSPSSQSLGSDAWNGEEFEDQDSKTARLSKTKYGSKLEMTSQPVVVHLSKTSVAAGTPVQNPQTCSPNGGCFPNLTQNHLGTHLNGPAQAIPNAYFISFHSEGPLGKIHFSRFVDLSSGSEYFLPFYGRQTRFSLSAHRVELSELANDKVSTFRVELQFALRQGNQVDPARTKIRILGCVLSSCSERLTPLGVKLKLQGGRR